MDIDRWERRMDMEDHERGRGRPSSWEDDYGVSWSLCYASGRVHLIEEVSLIADRPKRRRSPSPFASSHRPRRASPPPDHFGLPDPASLPGLLTFRDFAEWFRASHPQTAKADEEELRRVRAEAEGGTLGKEKIGMGKRYERYRREYTSRQVC